MADKKDVEFVDLTGYSDGEHAMPKRQKLEAGLARRVKPEAKAKPASRGVQHMDVDEDDEVVVLVDIGPRGAAGAGTSAAAAGPSRTQVRSRLPAANDADGPELDEDGVMVTGEVGQVPLRDMPHVRGDCCQHKFDKGGSKENAACCSLCFCYVCDRPASSCQFWGTGEYKQDHCQAHSSAYWDNLRKTGRSGNTSALRAVFSARLHSDSNRIGAAAADPTPKPAAPAAAPATAPAMAPGTAPATATATQAAIMRTWGSGPGAAPKREPLPDPRKQRDLLHLGQLRLPVKAVKGHTIAGLKQKLAPFGFWHLDSPSGDYGGKLCLGNIRASTWSASKGQQKPVFVKLLPLQSPVPEAPEGDAMRVRAVTVVHWDGAQAATTIGVTVHKSAKVSALITAVKAALGSLMGSNDTILMAQHTNPRQSFVFYADTNAKITDEHAREVQLWAFKVPKPPAEKDSKKDVKPSMQPNGISGVPAKPVPYVLVMHERKIASAGAAGAGGSSAGGQRRPGAVHGDDGDDSCYSSSSASSDDDDGMGYLNYNSDVSSTEKWATPVLLPLLPEHAQGGNAAVKHITKALEKALKPYSRNPATALQRTTLMRDSALNYIARVDPSRRPENRLDAGSQALGLMGLMPYGRDGPRVGAVYCWWSEFGGVDVAKMQAPTLDDSAAPAAMADTLKLMKEAKERAMRLLLLSQAPGMVLAELQTACKASPLPTDAKKRQSDIPSAATVLDFEAGTNGNPRLGTLLVDVFVWDKYGSGHRVLLDDCSTFNDPHTGGQRGFITPRCELRHTFNALIMRTAAGYKALQRWKELAAKDNAARSLKGIMDVVVSGEREAAEQPDGLTVKMHPYQLQSLKFMQDVEATEGGYRGMFFHPIDTPSGKRVWWSLAFDRAATKVPAMPWGGFLAEEMGLGKTVEVLGLILSNPAPSSVVSGCTTDDNKHVVSRATLVVCAVSLVGQWMAEAKSKLAGGVRIHMYHGQGRIRDVQTLASNYDLVVTTYATLGSDFKREANPPLGQIRWHRLVMDEGHTVKNPKVTHSKACIALQAERRWLCTGTPINNAIVDLYGQFCALHMAPMFNQPWFNAEVKLAFGDINRYRNRGMASTTPLLCVLDRALIRHTKKQVIAGEEVLKLPPKTEEMVHVTLSAEERRVYMDTYKAGLRLWNECKTASHSWINQHLLSIMALLLPLRRICSGGTLTPKDLKLPSTLLDLADDGLPAAGPAAPVQGLAAPPDQECSVCLDQFESPVITPCGHWYCSECIKSCLGAGGKCPLCRANVDVAALRAPAPPAAQAGSEEDEDMEDAAAAAGVLCDSKLKALVAELKAMRAADSTSKALIFSQYTSTLQWLQQRLPEEGFAFRTITGSMPLKQRAKAIEAFQHDPPTTVFLLSMRSGAVGINLTAASHVFLLEPCLNPALEEQAIGRAWRMGQQRGVVVKRFCVQGSIEERIIDVRKRRQEASGSNSSAAAHASPERGGSGKAKGAAVLAGALRSDKQNLKVAELEVLFREPRLSDAGAGPSHRA